MKPTNELLVVTSGQYLALAAMHSRMGLFLKQRPSLVILCGALVEPCNCRKGLKECFVPPLKELWVRRIQPYFLSVICYYKTCLTEISCDAKLVIAGNLVSRYPVLRLHSKVVAGL